jgi:opacity protein-like surface antigen
MKRFALPACVAATLAAGTVVPAYGAEHGWYIGTGIGYSRADIASDVVNNSLATAAPGQAALSINRNDDSLMYQLFLGYSFTSFIALEANAFRLGQFGYQAATATGVVNADLDMWGGSLDLVGLIPLGDSWRIYGRIGATAIQSTANYTGVGVTTPEEEKWTAGWKAGVGVGYEFESGVGFRAEYNYYNNDTALGGRVNTQVFSGTALYRFK